MRSSRARCPRRAAACCCSLWIALAAACSDDGGGSEQGDAAAAPRVDGGDSAGRGGAPEAGSGGSRGGQTRVEFEPGEPIDAEPMQWTYVHFPEAICRDGNATGLGINPNPRSDKLILYLEGGGACFNSLTCAGNSPAWGEADLGTPGGVLSRTNAGNPFKDWNLIYIPYCTGDVYSGSKMSGYNGQPQRGYINMGEYLKRIVPTFPDLTEVVLSGSSAGGFGAAWNAMRTQDAFGDIPVSVLDDSGPPVGPDYNTPCFQQRLGEMWGWADTIHPACVDCDVEAGNIVTPTIDAARMREPLQRLGLITYNDDAVIKLFLGFGLNDCQSFDALLPPTFAEGEYAQGLAELRTSLADSPHYAIFEVTGTGHTFLGDDLAAVSSGGTTLLDWIVDFRDGASAWGNVTP